MPFPSACLQDGVEAGPDYSSTGSRRLGTHAVSGGGTGGSRGSMLEEDEERGLWKLNLEMAVLRALEQQAMLQQVRV